MDAKKFERLQKSMEQGLTHAKGQKTGARETVFQIFEPKKITAAQIKALREKLKMSQPVFAELLNVSDKTVKAWEQNINLPSGIALRMLELIRKDPSNFMEKAEETGIIRFG
jgi:putative transcriptional regulator